MTDLVRVNYNIMDYGGLRSVMKGNEEEGWGGGGDLELTQLNRLFTRKKLTPHIFNVSSQQQH